jgi:hypothetical protein
VGSKEERKMNLRITCSCPERTPTTFPVRIFVAIAALSEGKIDINIEPGNSKMKHLPMLREPWSYWSEHTEKKREGLKAI